jgi:hypothetical protein
MTDTENSPPAKKPSILQILGSCLAAVFGVQTDKNRERDFTQGSLKDFVVVYAILVICMVAAMVGFVKLVLHFATGGAD